MDAIETFEHAGKTIKIYYDSDPLNPRKEWDNGIVMVHWHRRYDLGDTSISPKSSDELIQEYQEQNNPILAILPLYLYDHSGLSISTGSFSCPWDSGQVGWAFITEAKSKLMGFEQYDLEKLHNVIKSEVKTYNDYLTGQVYGYVVEGMDGDHIDSCWGFYGDFENVKKEAMLRAEDSEDPVVEREVERLRNVVTYAG